MRIKEDDVIFCYVEKIKWLISSLVDKISIVLSNLKLNFTYIKNKKD